jgi:hypothetical protein
MARLLLPSYPEKRLDRRAFLARQGKINEPPGPLYHLSHGQREPEGPDREKE